MMTGNSNTSMPAASAPDTETRNLRQRNGPAQSAVSVGSGTDDTIDSVVGLIDDINMLWDTEGAAEGDDSQSEDGSSTLSDVPSLQQLPLNVVDSDDESNYWDDLPDLVDDYPNNPLISGQCADLPFFDDFCASLKANECTEMFRYYISRQERLVTLMLRDEGKAEDFLEAARGNTSLEHLHLDISLRYSEQEMSSGDWMGDKEYYRRWQVIGQGIGNLMGLQTLQIHAGGYLHNMNTPDFRALGHVTQGAQQVQKLVLTFELFQGDEINFSESFRNHPKLKEIEFRGYIERQPMQNIASELLTIPNLSRIDMMNCFSRRIPCRILPDSFFALIGKDSMREVILQRCCLSEDQCRVLASGLSNSTTIEYLDFQYSRLEDRGCALVATALEKNESVQKLIYSDNSLDKRGCASLAQTLLANTSITRLQIEAEEVEWAPESQQGFQMCWLDPVFDALSKNATVSFFSIGQLCKWNDATADKFRGALESPTTGITELWLHSRSNAARAWNRIMPALAQNQKLKTLRLMAAVGHQGVVSTAALLAENTTLELLEAYPCSHFVCGVAEPQLDVPHTNHHCNHLPKEKIAPLDCVSARAVEALGRNKTLKKLMIDTCITCHTKDVSDQGCNQLVAALRKNFGLQDNDMSWGRGRCYKSSMKTITRLNAANRKYLLEDPADQARGVQLLIEVSDSVDCLFTHLQENPSLCDVFHDRRSRS